MGEEYNSEAYKIIYQHKDWKKTARRHEQQFAAKLYKSPYVEKAAHSALTRLSNVLNEYYKQPTQDETTDQKIDDTLVASEAIGRVTGVPITDTLEKALLPQRDSSGSAGQIGNFRLNLGPNSSMDEIAQARAKNHKNLDDVINGNGNLRERMTLLYNGMFINGGMTKEQIAGSTSLKRLLVNISQQDMPVVQSGEEQPDIAKVRLDLLQEMGIQKSKEDIFNTGYLARNLKKSVDSKKGRGNIVSRFFQGLKRNFSSSLKGEMTIDKRKEQDRKGLGERHYLDLGVGLSDREKAYGMDSEGRLKWKEGKAYKKPKKRITSEGMLQEAGPSGTTLRMMGAYKLLGATKTELLQFRLALIAWMVTSRDHSLYEILTGSKNAGVVGQEDLREASTMYMTVDPLTTDVIREKYTENGQFPHEVIYKQMLGEYGEERNRRRRKKGLQDKTVHYTGDKSAGDLSMEIYTTSAYIIMNHSRKYGSFIGKSLMRFKNSTFGNLSDYELNDSELRDRAYDLYRISSRVAQDTLLERGATEEEKSVSGSNGNPPATVLQPKYAFQGYVFRGGNLSGTLLNGKVNDTYRTTGLTSTSKNLRVANRFYSKMAGKNGTEKVGILKIKMMGKGALDITQLSSMKSEQEVLVPEGTVFQIKEHKYGDTDTGIPESIHVVVLEEISGPGGERREKMKERQRLARRLA